MTGNRRRPGNGTAARPAIAAIIVAAAVAGCTYSGTLDQGFYEPSTRTSPTGGKVGLRVAVVKDAKLEELRFQASGAGHGVDIALGEPIAEALEAELGTFFERVGVVTDGVPREDYDLLAHVTSKWKETYRDEWKGRYGYEVTMRVRFTAPGSDEIMAVYGARARADYRTSAATSAATALTGGSLGLLAPITVPLTTQSVGADAKDMIGRTISALIGDIGGKIANDSLFAELAARRGGVGGVAQGGTEAAPAASASAAVQPARAAPAPPGPPPTTRRSKYADFLDAVVVVRTPTGLGSGFFVSPDGYIVTNKHVVADETHVSIRTRSGRGMFGKVVGESRSRDLALVKVTGQGFAWLSLSPGGDAPIGTDVLAIGAPKGLSWSATRGIVSALRLVDGVRHVQTDAPINQGNSGGPLIDLETGRVIGVNSWGLRKDVAEGLNFAVASEEVLALFGRYLGG